MYQEVAKDVRRRLMIEALVAAGPRKSVAEYVDDGKELCEDCAGFRSLGHFIIFWLCDGTSNSHELPKRAVRPGFNSRMLAQDLGERFPRIITESLMKEEDLRVDLHKTLLGEIAKDWKKRLSDYLAEVEAEGELEWLFDQMPQMANESYRLKWSSTFLGGVYNERDKTLDIINIGTSGAVVFGDEPKQVTPQKPYEILLAIITPGNQQQVEVYPIEVETRWEHFENVEGFLALSDGIARDFESLLDDIEENYTSVPFNDLRRRLMMRGELSYDDQSVIIGRLMP